MSDFSMEQLEEKIQKSENLLKEDLATVRAGRANAALVDKVMVDYYGSPTPLKSLANISDIMDFRGSAIAEVQVPSRMAGRTLRGITRRSGHAFVESVQGVGQDALRRDANDKVKKLEKAGDYTEDDVKDTLKEIQELTDKSIKEIDEIVEAKEKEIMEV